MPAKSAAQQRLFGMIHACQKDGECASSKIRKLAKEIDPGDVEDFAKTKHDDLPDHKTDESWSFYAYLRRREMNS